MPQLVAIAQWLRVRFVSSSPDCAMVASNIRRKYR